jgi:hypothetical protein
VTISTSIKNAQQESQAYTVAMQVVDSEDIVQSISWSTGALERNTTTPVSTQITLDGNQTYRIVAFVWDGVDDPEPLSTPRVISLKT